MRNLVYWVLTGLIHLPVLWIVTKLTAVVWTYLLPGQFLGLSAWQWQPKGNGVWAAEELCDFVHHSKAPCRLWILNWKVNGRCSRLLTIKENGTSWDLSPRKCSFTFPLFGQYFYLWNGTGTASTAKVWVVSPCSRVETCPAEDLWPGWHCVPS